MRLAAAVSRPVEQILGVFLKVNFHSFMGKTEKECLKNLVHTKILSLSITYSFGKYLEDLAFRPFGFTLS